MELAERLRQEEEKRGRQWEPAERWRVILQTIRWAEQQATVRRNSPQACLGEQRRKLPRCAPCRSDSDGWCHATGAKESWAGE